MIPPELLDKLDNISKAVRQSNAARNNGEVFVREMLKRAKEAKITDAVPPEHVEGLAADAWLKLLVRDKAEYPADIIGVAAQRRNHKMMLKLLRHPDERVRAFAADQFQIIFAMLDGYFDEASSVINQILLLPTEVPEVKSALLGDMGRSSRRGSPRGIDETARRLIHDVDQVVSYHALRLLTALYDVRDWKAVLDRMISFTGEEDEAAEYFLSAGVEYLQVVVQHEPSIAEWFKNLTQTYPTTHLAIKSLQTFVRRNPDIALDIGLIDKQVHKQLKGA